MTRIAKIALIGGEIDLVSAAIRAYIKDNPEYLEKLIYVDNKITRAVNKTARDQAKERQSNLELL